MEEWNERRECRIGGVGRTDGRLSGLNSSGTSETCLKAFSLSFCQEFTRELPSAK